MENPKDWWNDGETDGETVILDLHLLARPTLALTATLLCVFSESRAVLGALRMYFCFHGRLTEGIYGRSHILSARKHMTLIPKMRPRIEVRAIWCQRPRHSGIPHSEPLSHPHPPKETLGPKVLWLKACSQGQHVLCVIFWVFTWDLGLSFIPRLDSSF